jgi:hypothetical protein
VSRQRFESDISRKLLRGFTARASSRQLAPYDQYHSNETDSALPRNSSTSSPTFKYTRYKNRHASTVLHNLVDHDHIWPLRFKNKQQSRTKKLSNSSTQHTAKVAGTQREDYDVQCSKTFPLNENRSVAIYTCILIYFWHMTEAFGCYSIEEQLWISEFVRFPKRSRGV